jgi:TolA-binding protein
MKDTRSLLLVLLSVGLAATWVYHFYDKANYTRVNAEVYTKDSSAIAQNIRDSLQKEFTAAVTSFDTRLDSSKTTSDSLQEQLTNRIKEINQLKSEISQVLKNPRSTSAEMKTAKQKMTELEGKVEELRFQNSFMEEEKRTLSARLDHVNGEVSTLEQNMRKLDEENKDLREKIRQAGIFMTSGVRLAAVDVRANEKEEETAQTKKADKFVASFVVQNNVNQYLNAEVFVVITQPDGQVLQNSAWESGVFDTKEDGRKNYTRRIKFDYEKGEQKQMIFSLASDTFQAGRYKLQVWHQGSLVGENFKMLK